MGGSGSLDPLPGLGGSSCWMIFTSAERSESPLAPGSPLRLWLCRGAVARRVAPRVVWPNPERLVGLARARGIRMVPCPSPVSSRVPGARGPVKEVGARSDRENVPWAGRRGSGLSSGATRGCRSPPVQSPYTYGRPHGSRLCGRDGWEVTRCPPDTATSLEIARSTVRHAGGCACVWVWMGSSPRGLDGV